MLIKLSSEQINQLGGLKDPSEFNAKFSELHEKANAPKTEQKVVLLSDVQAIFGEQIKTFTASVGAVDSKVETIKADVAKIEPDALVKKAEDAASKTAAKALGKVGASGAAATEANPNEGGTNLNATDALVAQGKYEEAYALDKNIQAEFSSAKCYAAFKRAEAKGSFSVFQPKTK